MSRQVWKFSLLGLVMIGAMSAMPLPPPVTPADPDAGVCPLMPD